MRITNQSKDTTLATKARSATTLASRMRGLMGSRPLAEGEALIIPGCQAIHMCFMRYAIDAVFVDAHNRVVGVVEGIKPFRFSRFFFTARAVIELPVGSVRSSRTTLGDTIAFDSPCQPQ